MESGEVCCSSGDAESFPAEVPLLPVQSNSQQQVLPGFHGVIEGMPVLMILPALSPSVAGLPDAERPVAGFVGRSAQALLCVRTV